MPESIADKVIAVIARTQQIPTAQLTLDTTFDELGMTSLDALGLIYELEEEFSIEIPNEEVLNLRDVRQAIESVRKLLPATITPEGEADSVS